MVLGSNPNGGNLLDHRKGQGHHGKFFVFVFVFVRFFSALFLSPLLGIPEKAEMLHHPCILGDPQTNGDKIRIGCLNPAFWGTHKWAEMLRQPCPLLGPL